MLNWMRGCVEWTVLTTSPTVVILIIAATFFLQAGLILSSYMTTLSTALIAIKYITPDGRGFVAGVMVVTSILAMIGALFRLGRYRLLIFLPQNFILAAMTAGSIIAVARGSYLDGTKMNWQHILADQSVVIAIFIIHWYCCLRRCRTIIW